MRRTLSEGSDISGRRQPRACLAHEDAALGSAFAVVGGSLCIAQSRFNRSEYLQQLDDRQVCGWIKACDYDAGQRDQS